MGGGHFLECAAVVEGEGQHLGPRAAAVGRPVQVFEVGIFAQAKMGAALVEERLQLDPTRHRRRTAMARHGEGAAGVGPARAHFQLLAAQPAAQEPAHEGVAGAEDVEHLHRDALDRERLGKVALDVAGEDRAALGAALQDDDRVGEGAHRPQRAHRIRDTAGDMHLLRRAHHEITVGQDRLQMARDVGAGDEAILAPTLAGQVPQDRPIVDIEHDLGCRRLGVRDGRAAHRIDMGRGEVGATDQQRPRRADEVSVEIRHVDGHVGAVFPVEDEGKGLPIAYAENDQGRQALGVGRNVAHVDALGGQGLADEAAHMLVADARQGSGFQAQPGAADGDVGGATADIFGETRHVLQPAAHLLAIEIDARPAEADDVEPPLSHRRRGQPAATLVRLPPSPKYALR